MTESSKPRKMRARWRCPAPAFGRPRLGTALLMAFVLFSSAVGVREAGAESRGLGPRTGLFVCLSICSTGLRQVRVPPPCLVCLEALSLDFRKMIGG